MPFDRTVTELVTITDPTQTGNPSFAGESFLGTNSYKATTDSYLTFPLDQTNLGNQFTGAFWYKVNASPDRSGILTIGDDEVDRNQGFRLFREGSTTEQRIKINIHNIANELGEKGHVLAPLKADTDRMIHAVNQFLLLTRTSPETFAEQREPVNVHVVAQEVISDLYGAIENKNQEIALEGKEAWLLSSQFVLYTLLQNLVSNASKYSPCGAQIIIKIERRKDELILSVCDSGPGIPADQRAVVLNRFKRASNSSPHSGSGLGLAIVDQIVLLHGAELSLDESSLGGLEVRVAFSYDYIL